MMKRVFLICLITKEGRLPTVELVLETEMGQCLLFAKHGEVGRGHDADTPSPGLPNRLWRGQLRAADSGSTERGPGGMRRCVAGGSL